MSLMERIEKDRNDARRGHNIQHSSFLSYLISESRLIGKAAGNRESTDDEIIEVIRKIIARNEENIRLSHGEDQTGPWQNKLLRSYLPVQMSDEQVEAFVVAFVAASSEPKGPKLMGPIMSTLKSLHPGQYDPKTASEIAKRLLQG